MDRPLDAPALLTDGEGEASTSCCGGPAPGLAAADASGRVYTAARDGSLRRADLRDILLVDGGDAGAKPSASATVIGLDPPLDFAVHHFALSSDGRRAAVAGPTHPDPDTYAARVVDLGSVRDGQGDASAESAPLAAALLAARPGLRIVQLAWHPASPRHVALLTSDGVLRLYDAARAAGEPEQAVELAPLQARGGGGRAGGGFGLTPAPPGRPRRPAAFAFGKSTSASSPWEALTVYVADTAGGLWSLCPLAPFGAALPGATAAALSASADAPAAPPQAREWVAMALPLVDSEDSATVRVAPHALAASAPALVGPWPVVAPPPPPPAGSTAALAPPSPPCARGLLSPAPTSDALTSLAWTGLPPGAAAVVAGTRGGWVAAAALAGPASPAWAPSAPRVADDEDDEQGRAIVAVSAVAKGVAPDDGSGRRALLLDAVDVGGGDDEGERGGGGDSDDDLDGAPPSNPVLLVPDGADPARVYAIRAGDGGMRAATAVAVDLAWLPPLAARLGRDSADGGSGPPPAPPALPPVTVTPLTSGDAWGPGAKILGAAAVAAPPADGGLALVVVGGGGAAGPAVRLLRAARAGGGGGGGGGAELGAAAIAGAAAVAAAGDAPAAGGGGPDPDLARVAAGPPATRPPPASTATDPATPAGAAALAAAAAALTDGPVAFIQDAAPVLAGRAEGLEAAGEEASARAAAVQAEAGRVREAAAALAPRLARAAALQTNLEARARLLARLHWARPAPLTAAEAAFQDAELPALEKEADAFASEVAGLKERAACVRGQHAQDAHLHHHLAPPTPAVPAAEVKAAKAAVADQAGLADAALAALAAVEAAVDEAEAAVARAAGGGGG